MPAHLTPDAVASARESLRLAAVHGDFSRFDQDDARTLAGMLAESDEVAAKARADLIEQVSSRWWRDHEIRAEFGRIALYWCTADGHDSQFEYDACERQRWDRFVSRRLGIEG